MYHLVRRTLDRAIIEMQYWTVEVRVSILAPTDRLLLAAQARCAAAAMEACLAVLWKTESQRSHLDRYRYGCSATATPFINGSQYAWRWVPDVMSTVRIFSTIESTARHWCEQLAPFSLTPSEAQALRRQVESTALALAEFAEIVETEDADSFVDPTSAFRLVGGSVERIGGSET